MKYLFSSSNTFTDQKNWCFNNREERTEGEQGIEAQIEQILKSPHNLSLAGLKKLESVKDSLTAEQKRKLNDLVEFHLSLVMEKRDRTFPNRVLFNLKFSKLWKFISPDLRRRVDMGISKEQDELKKISEKVEGVEQISFANLQSMLRFYRSVWNNKDIDADLRASVRAKLLDKTRDILSGYRVNEAGHLVCKDPNKKFQLRDKLFVLEAQRVFGGDVHFETDSETGKFANFGQAVVSEIKNELTGEATFKNRIEYLRAWELLECLVDNPDYDLQSVKPKIEALVEQTQAAEFLKWADGKKVLLPEHITALRIIKSQNQDNYQQLLGVGVDSGRTKQEEARLLDLEQKQREGQRLSADELSELQAIASKPQKGDLLDEFLGQWEAENGDVMMQEGDDKNPESVSMSEKVRKLRESINDKKLVEALKKTVEAFGAKQHFSKLLSENAELASKWNNLKSNIVIEEDPSFGDVRGEFLETLYEEIEAPLTDVLLESNQVPQGETPDQKQAREARGTQAQNVLAEIAELKTNPIGELKAKQDEVEGEIAKLIPKLQNNESEARSHVELAEFIYKAPTKASEMYQSYREDLAERVKQKRLTSADIYTLLVEEDNTNEEKIFEGREAQLLQKIKTFREGLKSTVLEPVLDELDAIIDGKSSFENWQQAFDEGLSLRNVYAKSPADIRALRGVLSDSELALSEVVYGVIESFRHEIFEKVRQIDPAEVREKETLQQVSAVLGMGLGTPNEAKILSSFVSSYDRVHNKIYDQDIQAWNAEEQKKYVEKREKYLKKEGEQNAKILETLRVGGHEELSQEIEKEIPGITTDQINTLINRYASREEQIALIKGNGKVLDSIDASLLSSFTEDQKLQAEKNIAEKILRYYAGIEAKGVVSSKSFDVFEGSENQIGLKSLNQIGLEVMPIVNEVKLLNKHLNDRTLAIASRLNNGDKLDFSQLNRLYFSDVENSIFPRLKLIRSELESTLLALFPEFTESFTKKYLARFDETYKALETNFIALRDNYKQKLEYSDKFNPTGDDFEYILKLFRGVESSLDLNSGEWVPVQKDSFDSLDQITSTYEFMADELGLFEEGGKDKAEKHYSEIQQEYKAIFEEYLEKSRAYLGKTKNDLEKMPAEKFRQVYGVEKSDIKKDIEEVELDIETFEPFYQKMLASPFAFQEWFKRYEKPETQSEAVDDMRKMFVVKDGVGEHLKKDTESFKKFLSDYKDYDKNRKGWDKPWRYLPRIYVKQWYSLLDIGRMIKQHVENLERLRQRREEEAVAFLGTKIFGNSAYGQEFQRKQREAEEQRVSEDEKREENKDFYNWREVLYKTKNKDQARAMINLLVNNGYMRWNDPEFWKVLMKFQKKVVFDLENDLNLPIGDQINKVGLACSEIWTTAIWNNWNGSLEGNLKKQMESNEKDFQNMRQNPARIMSTLGGMLESWMSGDDTVDPAAYEHFMFKLFDDARFNGPQDRRWFFLIMGMAATNPQGKTLISQEMMTRFNSGLLARIPFFDFFSDGGWKKDGKIVPPNTPGAEQRTWNYQDIQNWKAFLMQGLSGPIESNESKIRENSDRFFFEYIMSSDMAVTRASRMASVGDKEGDHDDAWMQFCGISYIEMAKLVNTRSEGRDIAKSQDQLAQLFQGLEPYVKGRYKYILEYDKMYGSTPEWQRMRKKALIEIGERIRVAFGGISSLSGNYKMQKNQTPSYLDKARYWEGDTGDVASNKKEIGDMVRTLVGQAGLSPDAYQHTTSSGETVDVFQSNLVVSVSENFAQVEQTEEYKFLNKTIDSMVSGDIGEKIFKDPSSIEQFLRNRYSGGL